MSPDAELPWRHVTPADYEGHMASPEVGQQPILDRIFAEVLHRHQPASLAVPGCGPGTGFRHIDPAITRRVVGVDINAGFLRVLRHRHGARLPGLHLITADLHTLAQPPGAFDLVHAGLLFEHVDAAVVLPRLAGWVAPLGALTVILQLPSPGAPAAADSPFASLGPVRTHMHLIPPRDLCRLAGRCGLREVDASRATAPGGKAFYVGHFSREAPSRATFAGAARVRET